MLVGQRVSTAYGNATIVTRLDGAMKGWFAVKLDNPNRINCSFDKEFYKDNGSLPFKTADLHPEEKFVVLR